MKRSTWLLVATLFGGYSLFAAIVSALFTRFSGVSLWSLERDATANLPYILAMNLLLWGGWVMFAPMIIWLGRRVRFERGRWRRAIAIHAPASVVITSAHLVWVGSGRFVLQRSFGADAEWWPTVWDAFFRTLDFELPVYWAIVGGQHAVEYARRLRARELRTARLETRLVEAQLQALQQQLHPHFLFNTLHAISSLVHRDPEMADAMLERLADLLRLTLRSSDVQEIPLHDELDYVRAYLAIEQVHFGDRLKVEITVDAAAASALVPTLILQPLVENAIRHGLEPKPGPVSLAISARIEKDAVKLAIRDDGVGLQNQTLRNGIGLSNTKSRLQRLYGARGSVHISNNPTGGVVAVVRMPFRDAFNYLECDPTSPMGRAARIGDQARE
jgi:two-component system, LytTR family, sensor kinase